MPLYGGSGGGDLLSTNNLSDVASAGTSRTNLGLGSLATQSGTFSGTSSGTNTGDQSVFQTIVVSGQSDVVADSSSDSLTLVAGSGITITTSAGGDSVTFTASGGGSGDVVGPASATDNAVARFDSTTGKLVQNSVVTIEDSTGNVAGVGTLNTHTIQGGTGTIALTSDITGTNSGTNTGDQLTFKTISVSGQSDVVADSAADTLTFIEGSGVTITTSAGGDSITISVSGGGSGDVVGPASATDNAIARFDSTTGKLIQNSVVTITDDGIVNLPAASSTSGLIQWAGLTGLYVTPGNVFAGFGSGLIAGNYTLSGSGNVGIGYGSLDDLTSGSNNIAIGGGALGAATSAGGNVAAGVSALGSATTATLNVAIGLNCMAVNTTGSDNTAVGGDQCLVANTTGNANAAFGREALQANTTGNQNVALGARAGETNATGSNNTFVGYFADATSSALSNVTAVGYGASVSASDTIVLGDGSAGVIVGGTASIASSLLTLTSTSRGFLPPRMTTAQRNAIGSPADGLIVFDTDVVAMYQYASAAWSQVGGGGANTALSNLASVAINAALLPDIALSNSIALGSSTKMWADLFLGSGGVINFNDGNVVIAHTAGVVTVSTGDMRVTSAGTNAASVVTVDGTQTLGNKTLTTPVIAGSTMSGSHQVTGRIYTDLDTLTDGTTITVDFSLGNKFTVTLGGNRTIAFSNDVAGQAIGIRLLQDGTGSRTITWPAGIKWAGGSAPTLTTTASKADWIMIVPTTSGSAYDGAVLSQGH